MRLITVDFHVNITDSILHSGHGKKRLKIAIFSLLSLKTLLWYKLKSELCNTKHIHRVRLHPFRLKKALFSYKN